MRVRISVEGDDKVLAALRNMSPKMKARLRPKLIAWGGDVLEEAKAKVPVGEDDPIPGSLRDSGRVIRPTISATKASLVLSVQFGGDALLPNVRRGKRLADNPVYAVVQHEDLTLKHDDGEPKFLERPFIAAAPQVPELVLEACDEAAGEA